MKNITRHKRISYCLIGTFFLISGIEYAVVLPTIWLYIHTRFNSGEYMLGIILSAYSLSAMVSGPILGRLADKTRKPKLILIFSAVCVIAGNIMYWLGLSEGFVLISRLVVGFGDGCQSVIVGELARVTAEEERTGILSILISVRQLGLLIGPAFTVFLRLANFYVGPILVDKYSVPGAFMACLWMAELFLFVLFYTDFHEIKRESDKEEEKQKKILDNMKSKPAASACSSNYNSYDSVRKDDLMATLDESDYRYMEIGKKPQHRPIREGASGKEDKTDKRVNSKSDTSTLEESLTSMLEIRQIPRITCKFLYKEYIREEIVAVIGIQFNCFFNQIGLETMVTPLSTKYLGFDELQNSIMYCFAAIEGAVTYILLIFKGEYSPYEHDLFNQFPATSNVDVAGSSMIIAVFVLVRYLSRRWQDRSLVLIGVGVLILAQCWLLYALPSLESDTQTNNLVKFAVGIILDVFALPFLSVCTMSLFSKITSKELQGMSHGLRGSVTGLAMILGPLWTGSTLMYPYIMIGVMLGLLLMSFIMLLMSYSRLKTNGSEQLELEYKRRHAESISEESHHLLS